MKPGGHRAEQDAPISFLAKPTGKLSILLPRDTGHEGGTGYPGANIYSATQAGDIDPSTLDLRKVVFAVNRVRWITTTGDSRPTSPTTSARSR